MAKNRLLLLGFGGHGRSVADVALSAGYSELLFVDSNAQAGEYFFGFPVVTRVPEDCEDWEFMPASGNNHTRSEQIDTLIEAGARLATLVATTATISRLAEVGGGCFVGHHAHVGPRATLGAGCLINTGAVVEHDCSVGRCVHVSVNATISGGCHIGDRCFIGAGASVIDGVSIGSDVQIGAGGVVTRTINAPGVYVGVPARPLR